MAASKPPSWLLKAKMSSLQAAMSFGMYLGSWAGPWPPEPSFVVEIPATISPTKGKFKLVIYTPASYSERKPESRYPFFVNFHGGGMSIGSGTDDSRWAKDVMEQLDAVFVSVEYRLAPEYVFPIAVQDSADAILYLVDHASKLGLDENRIGICGFSSGGGLVFTTLLLLEQLRRQETLSQFESLDQRRGASNLDEFGIPASMLPQGYSMPNFTIKCVIAWYPSVDFTKTREERNASNPYRELSMLDSLSSMFDTGYIYNSALDSFESAHPLLSPAAAPVELLAAALPDRILIYTCQYDALQKEGNDFAERLKQELGKKVKFKLVEKVIHAWDKMPNPIWPPERIEEVYKDALDGVKEYL